MASSGKKSKKGKVKTIPWTEFLQDTSGTLPVKKTYNWSEEVDDAYDFESRPTANVVLPTAPRAARGPDISDDKIPNHPPYMAYISNLPYDVDEEDIRNFFANMNIDNMRLPRDDREGGKLKGFGYVEFEDRNSLINAMSIIETNLKGRRIKIDVATSSDGDRRRGRMEMGRDRIERPEVTSGDWRSGPRSEMADSSRGGGRDGGFSREGGGGFSRDREGGGGGFSRDREGGGGFSRDREGGGGFSRERGEGGGFSRERGEGGGGFSREWGEGRGGFSRERGEGGFGRDSGFTRDRDSGFGRERDGANSDKDGDSNRPGAWRDGERPAFSESDRGEREKERSGYRDGGFRDRDRDSSRYGDGDRRGGGGGFGPRRTFAGDREGFDRDSGMTRGGSRDSKDDGPPSDRNESRARPRLNLQPRSKPVEEQQQPAKEADEEKVQAPVAAAAPVPAASIFGAAKPVDTSIRERQIEERLAKEKDSMRPARDNSRDNARDEEEPKREAWGRKRNDDRDEERGRRESPDGRPSRGSMPRKTEDKKPMSRERVPPPRKDEKPPRNDDKPPRDNPEKEMPKLKQPEPPNFVASNIFATLDAEADVYD